jgi:hypothetical protein
MSANKYLLKGDAPPPDENGWVPEPNCVDLGLGGCDSPTNGGIKTDLKKRALHVLVCVLACTRLLRRRYIDTHAHARTHTSSLMKPHVHLRSRSSNPPPSRNVWRWMDESGCEAACVGGQSLPT